MLTPWASDIIYELNQMQRWSYDYTTSHLTTTQGVALYNLPANYTVIKKIFYVKPTGQPQEVDRRERFEAARIVGDTSSSPANLPVQGAPRYYSLNNRQIEVFPAPNLAGPDAGGNYKLYIQGYQLMNPIVETTGTTLAANVTLTVPSTAFLTDHGIPTSGTGLSIRSAGNLGASSVADTFITNWSAFPTGATVTMTTPAVTAGSNLQVYFNSQPWVVTWWPKVMLFAMLREVASYLGNMEGYQLWESRYQAELGLLRAYEFDRSRSLEMAAAAHAGQNVPEERAVDLPIAFDVRGVL